MTAKLTICEFIAKAKKTHNTKYTYSNVVYVNNKTKVIITCKKHGKFTQKPKDHIEGRGCPVCSDTTLTTKSFITKAKKVHKTKYEYSHVKYVNNKSKITITCKAHGNFTQKPKDHLSGNGCPICSKRGYSQKAINWMNMIMTAEGIHIQHMENFGEYKIPGTKYKADGYCKQTKTIYEFYGDNWHGNREVYKSNDLCHPIDKTITAGELYTDTIDRENYIKGQGYNVVSIWEKDYRDMLKQRI